MKNSAGYETTPLLINFFYDRGSQKVELVIKSPVETKNLSDDLSKMVSF